METQFDQIILNSELNVESLHKRTSNVLNKLILNRVCVNVLELSLCII